MVKKLRLAGMAVVTLLSLSACQVLFVGVFPAAVGQMTARADLSALVAANPATSFNLAIVDAGSDEYVLLFSSTGFDPAQAHIVVMDPELNVLTTYTNGDLLTLSGSFLNGQHAMVDVNGQVVIGNLRFNAQPDGLAAAGTIAVPIGPSVTGLPVYPRNEVSFSASSGFLSWQEYDGPTWTYINTFSANLGPSSLYLSNVFTERDSGGMPDLFVLRDSHGGPTYFLGIPKQLIDGNTLSVFLAGYDIFTVFGPGIIEKHDLDESVGFSYAGIVAYDHQTESLIHFPLDDANNVSRVPMKWTGGMKLAMGNVGNYTVVWDPKARVLSRYEPWW